MDKHQIISQLEYEVFKKQRVLADIYQTHRDKSIFDYVNSWSMPRAEIDEKFAAIFEGVVKEIYGSHASEAVAAQLRQTPLVSTIDHHGILNHPFFVNSNLIFSQWKSQRYLICLSTAGISLNNSSWPGCFLYTEHGQLRRVSLFPDSHKTRVLLKTEKIGLSNIQNILAKITRLSLPSQQKQKILALVRHACEHSSVLYAKDFVTQASLISSAVWEQVFPEAPAVVYVPIERLVSRLLRELVIPDKNHLLHAIFCTEIGWDLLEKYFQGSLGAFSSARKGSFLYWGTNSQGRRVHLVRRGKQLLGENVTVGLDEGLHTIKLGLEQETLYPSTLVCFLVMLHYGLACIGGFNQVNWLANIQENFVQLLKNLSLSSAAAQVKEVVTRNFAEANLAFAVKDGLLIKPTGVDLYAENTPHLFSQYRELAQQLTVGEGVRSLLPEIYRVITPGPQRNPELLNLSDAEAAILLGIERKVRILEVA